MSIWGGGTSAANGSVIPNVDNAYDLGSGSFRWKDGYFAGTLTVGTLAITNFTVTTLNGTTINCSGNLTVNGNTVLGNAVTDTITAGLGAGANNGFTKTATNEFWFGNVSAGSTRVEVGGGFRVQGTASFAATGGSGIEVYKSATTGIVASYNRSTATHEPMQYNGSQHTWQVGGVSVAEINTSNNLQNILGNINVTASGKGFGVKEGGAAARMGTAVLVAGTVTVNTTSVAANSRIFLTVQVAGGTQGHLSIGARVAGTSFVINSTSGTDTSTVAWEIKEPL